MVGKPMTPRALTQQRDVAMRRVAIALFASRHICNRRHQITMHVNCVQPRWLIAATRNSFGGIKAKHVSACNLVKNAPDFLIRIGTDVGWSGLTLRSAFKIEPQSIPHDTSNAERERPDAASLDKCSLMHVGAVREIPDFIRWPTMQNETVPPVVPTGHQPGFREQSSPSNSHTNLSAIQPPWRQCR